MLHGCDLSKWQGKCGLTSLKSTFDFVIVKATEGFGYTDPTFSYYRDGLRSTNQLRGYYHFARPDLGNKPETEAEFFLNTIGSLQSNEMLVLDFEVSFANPVPWCFSWLEYVYAKTHCKPLIYLNQSQVKGYNWSTVINNGNGLWLARYDFLPDAPPPVTSWPCVAMRQYSDLLPYESLKIDGNVFYGDAKTWAAYSYQGEVMSVMYKGLDLTNQDSMKVAVDIWDEVIVQKLWVKAAELKLLADLSGQVTVSGMTTEFQNRLDQISRLKEQLTIETQLRIELATKLSGAGDAIKVYENDIVERNATITEQAKEIGALKLEIAQLKDQIKNAPNQPVIITEVIEKTPFTLAGLIKWFKQLWERN